VITCTPLVDSPNNGEIECLLGDDGQPNPGDTCSYTCNAGFVIDGITVRTCQNDATWSGTEPTCRQGVVSVFYLTVCVSMEDNVVTETMAYTLFLL